MMIIHNNNNNHQIWWAHVNSSFLNILREHKEMSFTFPHDPIITSIDRSPITSPTIIKFWDDGDSPGRGLVFI